MCDFIWTRTLKGIVAGASSTCRDRAGKMPSQLFAPNMSINTFSKDEEFPYISCVTALQFFLICIRVSDRNMHILSPWSMFGTVKNTFWYCIVGVYISKQHSIEEKHIMKELKLKTWDSVMSHHFHSRQAPSWSFM